MNILDDLNIPPEDRLYGARNKVVRLEGKTIRRDVYRIERRNGHIYGSVLKGGKWQRVVYDEKARRWREDF